MFIAVSFKIAPNWKRPKYPSVGECKTNCGTSIQWNTT